jgi:hypothetical protein
MATPFTPLPPIQHKFFGPTSPAPASTNFGGQARARFQAGQDALAQKMAAIRAKFAAMHQTAATPQQQQQENRFNSLPQQVQQAEVSRFEALPPAQQQMEQKVAAQGGERARFVPPADALQAAQATPAPSAAPQPTAPAVSTSDSLAAHEAAIAASRDQQRQAELASRQQGFSKGGLVQGVPHFASKVKG